MPLTILALDPSVTSTGWALYEGGKITSCGFKTFPPTEHEGDRLIQAINWLSNMIALCHVELVVMEQYFFRKKYAAGADVNPEIRAAFKIATALHSIHFCLSKASVWKKVVSGRSSPTKQEKRKYGKDAAKKIFIVQALEKKFGLKCPTKIPNHETGKIINFKYDISDAISILVAHLIENGKSVEFGKELFEFDAAKK